METLWRIELLGHLCVRNDRQDITRFRTRKSALLLAYLACFSHQSHAREALIELFWPDGPIEAGRNNLSVALNSLRRQLEPPGIPSGAVLIADRSHVRFHSAAVRTDVLEYKEALQAVAATKDAAEQLLCLKQAVEIYRGPLLPGYYEDWVFAERDWLANAHLNALRELVKGLAQAREYEQAIDYALRMVQVDPLRERPYRDLMQLYVAVGRPATALETYQELKHLLEKTLGAAPTTATRELADQIAERLGRESNADTTAPRASSSPAAPLPPATAPTTLHPQSIPTQPVASGNLPLSFTRFFGRVQEIERSCELLHRPDCRLLTLTGPGGVGKTRLAIAVARSMRDAFAGGIWFVPLTDLTDPDRLLDIIRDALNLPRPPDAKPLTQIVAMLSAAPALLLLDNLEPLDEGAVNALHALLEAIPTLKLLGTARQPFALEGEHEMAVHPLPTPPPTGSPTRLLEFPSVQLFVDRAQARQVDFQITPGNAESIARLCDRLEGMPLAVELAASWAKTLSPAQMLSQLEHRFDFLVSRRTDLPTRHRTLRAVIESSYRLLSPELQHFFVKLAIFRGGWTLEAARAVCAEPGALEFLALLRDRSLIVTEDGDPVAMRYRMLETLREYALEKLEPMAGTALERQRADFFLALIEEAERGIQGPDQAVWLDRLEREHDNLRAVLAWAQADTNGAAVCLQMAGALWRFWMVRGYFNEGRAQLEKALSHPRAADLVGERARALRSAGILAWHANEFALARDYCKQSLAIYQAASAGDMRGQADVLYTLGAIMTSLDEYTEARACFKQSLANYHCTEDRRGIANTINNRANIAYLEGKYRAASALYIRSKKIRSAVGDERGVALSLFNLATVACRQGDFARAYPHLQQSLVAYNKVGDKRGIANALTLLARAEVHREQAQRAALLLGAAEALRESIGSPLPSSQYREYHDSVAVVQAVLHGQAFVEAWTTGRLLPMQQTIEFALSELSGP